MEVILSSHIARVVLAYLYDQKLNRAADEFCKASPYLKEERNCLKSGFRPAMYISFKLTDLFREYSEIQIKLNSFVEKYGNQLEIPSDLSMVKKIDYLLVALRKNRRIRTEQTTGRKRRIPSPQPSLASSTPEVAEPKQKRLCMNRSFIVLNESGGGRNLSNLSHISPIADGGTTTQDDAGDDESNKEEDEEQEMSQIDLWKQTLLENEIYPEKIADLINKGRETSMNQQPQQQEAEVKEVAAPVAQEYPEVAKSETQSFNFNFDELISNIVNNIPVFEDMLEENKPPEPPVADETERPTPVSETPLKARLRKTCKKNYANLSPLKKSCKKVKVISDVPFEGSVPEVLRSLKIDPPPVQPEVSSTEDQPIASSSNSNSATQYYVIQSDNTTKLVDINQLQFPTQPTATVASEGTQNSLSQTLIPIAGNGIPENTYFILDGQLPLVLGAFTNEPQPQPIPSTIINPSPDTLLSPDKFLIFPNSAPEPVPMVSITMATTTAMATTTTTASIVNSIPSTLIKQEIKTTPQNVSIPNPKARSASTPSRKASHIRILNFHTPAKPSSNVGNRIATPGSAPASVDNRRLPLTKLSNLLEEQEPSPSPITTKLAGDWDAVHGIGAITATNPNSVSNTPRVSRKPSVRVLSRSASVEPSEPVVVPETPVPEVTRKVARTPVVVNPSDMEEWRRIRSVSKSNFDQHLRLVEEEKQHSMKLLPRKKRPVTATTKKKKKKSGDATLNASAETTIEGESSLTDTHAQMLEDALASAKKGTPVKREEVPQPDATEEEPEDNAKIYVKIATPKKKAEAAAKASPKRKKSVKKRRSGSTRKKVVRKKKPVVPAEPEKVASPKPEQSPEEEPKKVESPAKEGPPVKPEVSEVPEVHVTPPEPPKAVKDPPKVLAKKSSAEYARLEKEQQQQQEVPDVPPVPSDFSFNVSALLETPFKAELENFPVTPRFLMPDPLQDTPITKYMRDLKSSAESSSMAKAFEIQTPSFPITPGLVSTPKSATSVTSPQSMTAGGFSSRRTDYSSGSSYYKPDESEDLDKNLESMLQNERKKRPPAVPEPLPPPEPELEPEPEQEPEQQPEPESVPEPVPEPPHNSSSSSSSSSSSDSSDSSSASSPETSPVKPETSPVDPIEQLLQSNMQTIYEMRRIQRAELEAKKQRTIARMKIARMSPPTKRIERKFSGAPGFKSRKVVLSRGTKEPPKKVPPKSNQLFGRAPLSSKPVPPVSMKTTSSSSTKRKNPTPRKVVYLDNVAPILPKKHSPKRKPTAVVEQTRKSPRTQPKPTHPIEGTYESENLSRLCCTPDPEHEEPALKKQVYAFKSPERPPVPPEAVPSVTPDSNKENLSTDAPNVDDSFSSEEEEDELTFRIVTEDDSSGCYFRFQFDDKKKSTVPPPSAIPESPRVIKKCNVVLDGQKICIQPHDAISLFEQEPSKKTATAGSPKKKSSKSSKKPAPKEPVKKPEPPAPEVPTPTTPCIKAKINVVSAVRTASNPVTGKRFNRQLLQRSAADSGRSLLRDSALTTAKSSEAKKAAGSANSGEKDNGAASSGSAAASGEKMDNLSPSPKMPLKLDMKKKHHQQQSSDDKKSSSGTAPEQQPKSEKPAAAQPKEESSIDIAAILSHLHGS